MNIPPKPVAGATAARAAVLALCTALLAPALAAADNEGERTRDGAYAVLAGGGAVVDHDCGFSFDCERSSTGVVRLAAGWRSGAWAVEGWWLKFGRAEVGDIWVKRSLSLRGIGGVVAWHHEWSDQTEWLFRLGVLRMRHERTGDGVHTASAPLVGVALVHSLTPAMRLELGWDATRADGNNVSSTVLQTVTVGVHLRF
ncbi:MAG: hypothetical protein KA141_12285 [Rubrivivax sp.]|nr:hypothetical protein [Rubrivivax sp.]